MTSHSIPLASSAGRSGRRAAPWVFALGCAVGLALGTVSAPVRAQAPVTSPAGEVQSLELSGWTGKPQSPAFARKEAGAALVQGRRECARERNASQRNACLRLVSADHAAMLKRIGARSGGTAISRAN
jgi:hypothetical protein